MKNKMLIYSLLLLGLFCLGIILLLLGQNESSLVVTASLG